MKITIMEEPVMSREHLICRAISYSKETGESISNSARLNGLATWVVENWLCKYGVPWKKQNLEELSKEKIMFCRKNQHKTLKEISLEKKWKYINLLAVCQSYHYKHPKDIIIKQNRKYSEVLRLLKDNNRADKVCVLTHSSYYFVKRVRDENNIEKHGRVCKEDICVIKQLIMDGKSDWVISLETKHSPQVINKIRYDMEEEK